MTQRQPYQSHPLHLVWRWLAHILCRSALRVYKFERGRLNRL